MSAQRPSEYRDDHGELVRAHRLYTGLSQRTFAERLGIKERSLSDIEIGRRSCPPGFIDTVTKIVDDFDVAVDKAIDQAEQVLSETKKPDGTVHAMVSTRAPDEWARAVIGRAAVTSGLIMPEAPPVLHEAVQ